MIFGAAVLLRVFSCILFLSTIFQGVHVVTFFKYANHKQQLVYNVFCSYRVVAFWLSFYTNSQVTPQLHRQVSLFLCRTTTLWHRQFEELSRNRSVRCYRPFEIQALGTQTWPRRLVLSPRLRLLRSLRHPPAPVPPALPPSLQVRLLCPRLFQLKAHLAVLRLSLLSPSRPPPTCL